MSIFESALLELKSHGLDPFPRGMWDLPTNHWEFELNAEAWAEAIRLASELNAEFMAYGGTTHLFGYDVTQAPGNLRAVQLVPMHDLDGCVVCREEDRDRA